LNIFRRVFQVGCGFWLLGCLLAACQPASVSSLGGLNPPRLEDAYNIQPVASRTYNELLSFSYHSRSDLNTANQQLRQAFEQAGWKYVNGGEVLYQIPSRGESWTKISACFSKDKDYLELIIRKTQVPESAEISVSVTSLRSIEVDPNCR
jgi:hypothetical protein